MATNKPNTRDSGKTPPKAHPKSNKSDTPSLQQRRKPPLMAKRKSRNEIVTFAGTQTGHPILIARHGRLNAITANRRGILQTCADLKP